MQNFNAWDVLVGRVKDRWDKTKLRVQPFSDVENRFAAGAQLCAEKEGKRQLLTVQNSQLKAGFWVCDFNLPDSPSADALVGAQLFIARAMRPALPDGEFYPDELIGMAVKNENGDILGEVEEVLETPHYEILALANSDLMIPVVEEFIVSIDGQNRQILAQNVENLRE